MFVPVCRTLTGVHCPTTGDDEASQAGWWRLCSIETKRVFLFYLISYVRTHVAKLRVRRLILRSYERSRWGSWEAHSRTGIPAASTRARRRRSRRAQALRTRGRRRAEMSSRSVGGEASEAKGWRGDEEEEKATGDCNCTWYVTGRCTLPVGVIV